MATRHSIIRGDEIEYSFWLVFDEVGGAKMTRDEPSVAPRQRAMRLSVTLPRAIFRTPTIKANVTVPANGSNADGEIAAAVDLVSETLKGVFGGEIVVRVGEDA